MTTKRIYGRDKKGRLTPAPSPMTKPFGVSIEKSVYDSIFTPQSEQSRSSIVNQILKDSLSSQNQFVVNSFDLSALQKAKIAALKTSRYGRQSKSYQDTKKVLDNFIKLITLVK